MRTTGERKKAVTIKDVAAAAGVSFKTVSRVINKDSTVREENREKVLRAVESLDYKVDLVARNLRSASSRILGLLYDRMNAFYIANIQNGAINVCEEYDYSLQILPVAHDQPPTVEELLELSSRSRLAGLILTPPFSEQADFVAGLHANGIPLVGIISKERADTEPETSALYTNDVQVGAGLARYLIELGHKRIAFLWGQETHRSSIDRYKGYAQELAMSGLVVRDDYVKRGAYTFRSGYDRTIELLGLAEPPTAIIASSDEIAAGALAAAANMSLSVPSDLSVVCARNTPLGFDTWPDLTSYDLGTEALCASATRLLISELEDKASKPRMIKIDLAFHERGSSAPAPKI